MVQVIMNLAINARDAMPTGGKLTLETANAELDEAYARRHVPCAGTLRNAGGSDTGVGMDATTQSRIFEPFLYDQEPGKGTGLVCRPWYGIVKQSGGKYLGL
jgi:signal transduction histidine kinase